MQLFNLITGWSRHHTAEGLVLLPPDGMARGAVQISEQVRPLRSLRAVLENIVERTRPDLRARCRFGPAWRLVTGEGEYVALGSIHSRTADGADYEHLAAMVLGDDSYALIEGIIAAPALAPTIREIVRLLATNYFQGLGEQRRRRFLFTPPPGWRPVASAHAVHYYGPRHPRGPGVLHVFDARPATLTTEDSQDRLLFLDYSAAVEKDPPLPATTFKSRKGLFGQLIKQTGLDAAGRRAVSYQATLLGRSFVYLSRLETIEEEERYTLPALLDFLDSVVPVPAPTRSDGGDHALIHWSD